MADGKKEIVVRVVTETKGGGSSGGGGGAGGNASLTKKTTDELEKQLKIETNLIQKKKILNELIKRETKAVGGVTDKAKALGKEWQANQKKLASFNKAVKTGSAGWGQAISSFQFKFNALGNIMANVTSTITRGFVSAIKSIINVSADFEEQMSAVKAITGATGEEFNKLRKDAVRLGGATIFTSKQVGELQEAYAKLGFSTNEILNVTEATLDLAAATGEGLAESAKIAGSTLRAFGLDASQMTSVIDTMAKSFTSSALDLEKFRESMKFVAPVARSAGFSIAETTAVLATLADTGLYGSLAGTSFKNILLKMSDASSDLSKEAGGASRGLDGMAKMFENLTANGFDLTEALELTDQRAVTAFSTLSRAIPTVKELAEEIKNAAGISKEMAETRMDNFRGSVEKLEGAWESLVLQINESNSGLRLFVDWLTKVVEEVGLMLTSVDDIVKFEGLRRANEEFKRWNATLTETDDKLAMADGYMTEANKTIKEQTKLLKEESDELEKLRNKWFTDPGLVREQIEDVNLIRITIEEQKALVEKLTEFKKEEINRNKEFSEEERLRKLAELERDKKTADKAAEERLAELEKFNKARQSALDVAEKIRINTIKNETQRLIAEENFRYDKQMRLLNSFLKEKTLTEEEHQKASLEAWQAYNDNVVMIYAEGFNSVLDELKKGFEEKVGMSMDKYLDDFEKRMREGKGRKVITETENVIKTVSESIREFLLFNASLTGEQLDTMRTSAQEATRFIVDQMEKMASKRTEIADRAVADSERQVNQAQRALEIELELAEVGFASNVSLRQRELEEAKKAQDAALAQQKAAQEQERKIQALTQASSLITASANILAGTARDPVSLGVAIGSIALMLGTFIATQAKIKDAVKYAEGGEIGGRKHSAGGTLIEAEQGEFVVRASEYAKNKELVNAINDGKLSGEWKTLNSDLNVSLDDTDTARLMNKHFGSSTQHFDWGRIEKRGNTIRKVRYA